MMSENTETKEKAIPWRDNSFFVMTFYSILTAMVGAIMALAVGDQEIAKDWYWPIGLLFVSLVFLIYGVEKYGEAVDEDDIDKYLAWLLAYNIGTAAMFFGIAAYIGLHYHLGFATFAAILAIAFFSSWKWWKDTCFLLFKNEQSYEAYRQELLGNRTPEKDRDFLMTLHGFFRKRCRGGRTTR
jgi:small-conductance mechanosensitive channel